MTAEVLTSIRELHTRVTDGIQVRLLWCQHDGTLWVTVVNTKTGDAFHVGVQNGERPLDVFHHPYAYAAHHGVETSTLGVPESEVSLAA
jgi:hypothetical protein